MPGSRRSTGRLFHAAGEETANTWGSIVTVQVHGTKSRPAAAERNWEQPSIEQTGVKYPARYGGTEPCRHQRGPNFLQWQHYMLGTG